MDQRIIHRNEIEVLMLQDFNVDQKEHVFNVLKILSKMIILDTEGLFKVYKFLYGKELKIKYLKLAVRNNLLIEYKKNYETENEENKFFYILKSGGKYALESANVGCIVSRMDYTRDDYNKLLEFNYRVIEGDTVFVETMESGLEGFWGMEIKEQAEYVFAELEESYDYRTQKDHFGQYTKAVHPKYT